MNETTEPIFSQVLDQVQGYTEQESCTWSPRCLFGLPEICVNTTSIERASNFFIPAGPESAFQTRSHFRSRVAFIQVQWQEDRANCSAPNDAALLSRKFREQLLNVDLKQGVKVKWPFHSWGWLGGYSSDLSRGVTCPLWIFMVNPLCIERGMLKQHCITPGSWSIPFCITSTVYG